MARNRRPRARSWPGAHGSGYLIQNSEVFNYWHNQLLNAASTPFEYEGLPDTIDRWYMERMLVERGSVAGYEFVGDLMATPWINRGGEFTPYGLPSRIQGFTGWRPVLLPDEDKFAIGFDRQVTRSAGGSTPGGITAGAGGVTTLQIINFHAKRLYELEQTRRANLRHQRRPFVLPVKGNGRTLESIRSAYLSVESFDPVIEIDAANNVLESIETIKTDVPYAGTNYIQDLSDLLNAAMSELGISGSSNKKERMITAELDLNRQQDNTNLRSRMMAREEFTKKLNDLFGTNITVGNSLIETDTDVIADQAASEVEGLES